MGEELIELRDELSRRVAFAGPFDLNLEAVELNIRWIQYRLQPTRSAFILSRLGVIA